MVARNFASQGLPGYAQLLQLEDDREFLPLEQLKPEHLQLHKQHQLEPQQTQHNVYYELTVPQSSCTTSMYLGGASDESGGLGATVGGAGAAAGGVGPAVMELPPQVDSTRTLPRKRKGSYHDGSDFDDDTEDGKSCRTDDKKQNHSEIEKRRRDKMNTYITELSAMVPMCHAMSRKLDKLTVLRMAVQHLRTIRGAVPSYPEGHYKPACLSDEELKHLILQAAEGFLFVVGCDRGRILFVSESVSQVLNFSQGDLLGQSWFDILHPKDVAKVKEQLSASDLCPRERLIDAKTMLPVRTDVPASGSRLCPGARRSFFCRMKRKVPAHVKEEADTTSCPRRKKQHSSDRRYSVIQCTGYLKSWAPEKMGLEESELADAEGGACNLSCLVAVGRLQPALAPPSRPRPGHRAPNTRPLQFTSRHAMDGKFLFVDQRSTLALGFLPQELLGTSMYEYYHPEDVHHLAESHKAALSSNELVTTKVYWFRSKEGSFVSLQSEWKAFKNPWTKDVDYLIAKNSVIMRSHLSDIRADARPEVALARQKVAAQANYDFFSQSAGSNRDLQRDMQRIISSHVEASKIGRKIADEALDSQRLRGNGDSSPNSIPSPSVPSPVERKLLCQRSPSVLVPPAPSPQRDCKEALQAGLKSPLATSPASDRLRASPSVHRQGSQGAQAGESSDVTTDVYRPILSSPSVARAAQEGLHASEGPTFTSIRNNVTLSSLASTEPGLGSEDDMMEMMAPVLPESPGHGTSNDGNDEAAMAVIMSLLEADAGLGGPVDFSGLPWPLP